MDDSGETAVVDPYDAPKIDQAAKDHGANVSCAHNMTS